MPRPQQSAPVPEPAMQVTSELRWFADGDVPAAVALWFTHGGSLGACEERSDLYRLDGHVDVGVKLRSRKVLELKRRRSRVEGSPAPAGPTGAIEVWDKWSPADGLVPQLTDDRWIEVHKRIVRRRFTSVGSEVVLTDSERTMAGAGCDAEVVALTVQGTRAWTLALAAYGPLPSHLSSISAAWTTLGVDPAPPPVAAFDVDASHGYPELLERRFGDRASVTGRDR